MGNLAEIVSGATQGSTSVTVALIAPNGTVVLIHRGELLLGHGSITAGSVAVALSTSLATGDIIQASVASKGNQCGSPALVTPTGIRLTGWKTASEIEVVHENGSTDLLTPTLFFQQYGFLPASLYDPAGLGAIVAPEWEAPVPCDIQFDVVILQQSNQTNVTVQNVQFAKGGALIRWNEGSWSNTASMTFTSAGINTVDVRGADDEESMYARKTLNLALVTIPVTPVPDARIKFNSWRNYGNGTIKIEVNTRENVQARINGGGWLNLIAYELDYREEFFFGIADGPSTIQIRVTGEADSAKWVSMNFVKGY